MTVIFMVLMLVAVLLTKNTISDITSLRRRLTKSREALLRLNKNAITVPGKVLSTGYGIEYDFPYLDAEEVMGKKLSEEEVAAFEKKRRENTANRLEYGEVLFRYGYSINGDFIVSRTISIYGNDMDLEFFYTHKKGDTIKVYVDPEDPLVSMLVKPTEKAHDHAVWDILFEFMPKTLISILVWGLVIGFVYSRFA